MRDKLNNRFPKILVCNPILYLYVSFLSMLQKLIVIFSSLFFFADLLKVQNRNINDLSGGELQRFAIAVVCVQEADM